MLILLFISTSIVKWCSSCVSSYNIGWTIVLSFIALIHNWSNLLVSYRSKKLIIGRRVCQIYIRWWGRYQHRNSLSMPYSRNNQIASMYYSLDSIDQFRNRPVVDCGNLVVSDSELNFVTAAENLSSKFFSPSLWTLRLFNRLLNPSNGSEITVNASSL